MAEETRGSASFLARKHILLDTCFIIKAKENMSLFKDVFFLLNELSCTTTIHSLIVNEFLRGSKTKAFIDGKKSFLNEFNLFNLPITPEIIENSIEISNIYSNKNLLSNQISIIDCINAAFLNKYRNDLFLLTLDYKDYPIVLFDRVKIITMDAGNEIFNCCIFKINPDKYDKCLRDFNNSAFV